MKTWLSLGGTLLLVAVVHLAAFRAGHVWGDDFALYVAHARNLVEGVPYADTGYLYNPHVPDIGPPTYPPGAAFALAPIYACFGLHLVALKVAMIAWFLLFLLAIFLAFRDQLTLGRALALVALVGLNRFFLTDASMIGSDMPFLALLYLAFLAIAKAEAASEGSRRRAGWCAAVGLVVYLAYATRTLGVLLLPAWWGAELARTRRISRPTLLATAEFVLLAAAQGFLLHSDRHYLDQMNAGPAVLARNALGYLVRATAFWHNGYFGPAAAAIFAVMGVLALLGYSQSLRHRLGATEVFTPLYLLAILLWPSYQAERYLYPLVPLYLFYALQGLDHPWLAARLRFRRTVVAALAVAIALSYAGRLATLDTGPLPEGVAKRESLELFEYLRRSTGSNDVLVFIKPRAMALFTRRKTSVYHLAQTDAELWAYFRQIGVTRLIVVENDAALGQTVMPGVLPFLREFVHRQSNRLERVFGNGDFTVYAVKAG